jgi:hypothetical protein
MNNDKKMHFWIPDTEVQVVEKRPRGGIEKRFISNKEHGS